MKMKEKSKLFILMEYQGYDDSCGTVYGIYRSKKRAKMEMFRRKRYSSKYHIKWPDIWTYHIFEIEL